MIHDDNNKNPDQPARGIVGINSLMTYIGEKPYDS